MTKSGATRVNEICGRTSIGGISDVDVAMVLVMKKKKASDGILGNTTDRLLLKGSDPRHNWLRKWVK